MPWAQVHCLTHSDEMNFFVRSNVTWKEYCATNKGTQLVRGVDYPAETSGTEEASPNPE